MINDIDKFKAEIKEWSGSKVILIPSNIVKFAGLSDKDIVEVLLRRIENE